MDETDDMRRGAAPKDDRPGDDIMKRNRSGHALPLCRAIVAVAAGLAICAVMATSVAAETAGNAPAVPDAPDPGTPKESASAPAGAAVLNDPNYQLGSGDHIRIIVYGQPDLSGEFHVDGAGRVSLPLVGDIKAGGRSVGQFEVSVVDALKPQYLRDPRVSVEVLNFRPFYIVGEVQKPGNYPYTNGMTVINAVAMAGGFTYRADDDDFTIRHANDPSDEDGEDADRNTKVKPGDVITVPERWF
jgi:polysaccharide export outer membrane protein